MHVYDAASAFDAILHKGETKGVYNIGAHEERTVLSVAQDIGNALGVDISSTITHVQDRKFNDRRYFIDCSKLLALGWTQKVSWEEGLKETIEWYTKNDDKPVDTGATSAGRSSRTPPAASPAWWARCTQQPRGHDGRGRGCRERRARRRPCSSCTGAPGGSAASSASCSPNRATSGLYGRARLEDRKAVIDDIKRSKCTHILMRRGRHRPPQRGLVRGPQDGDHPRERHRDLQPVRRRAPP